MVPDNFRKEAAVSVQRLLLDPEEFFGGIEDKENLSPTWKFLKKQKLK